MKRTRNILMILFCEQLFLAGLLYVCGEFFEVDMAVFANISKEALFVISTVMILLTLAAIPLGLRLFKFKKVAADLRERGEMALLKWGVLRLSMIGDLLVINTLFYYIFGFEPAFGYLAVICMLSMPFIVPTMSRCEAEVSAEETDKEIPENTEE